MRTRNCRKGDSIIKRDRIIIFCQSKHRKLAFRFISMPDCFRPNSLNSSSFFSLKQKKFETTMLPLVFRNLVSRRWYSSSAPLLQKLNGKIHLALKLAQRSCSCFPLVSFSDRKRTLKSLYMSASSFFVFPFRTNKSTFVAS